MMAIKNEKFTLLLQMVSEKADATLQDLCDHIAREVSFSTPSEPSQVNSLAEGVTPKRDQERRSLGSRDGVTEGSLSGLPRAIKRAWH